MMIINVMENKVSLYLTFFLSSTSRTSVMTKVRSTWTGTEGGVEVEYVKGSGSSISDASRHKQELEYTYRPIN